MSADKRHVVFRYKDYHDGSNKMMRLKTQHFMTRVLWHVDVKGQHQVRYYGLYAGGAQEKRDRVRQTLGIEMEKGYQIPDKEPRRCLECGHELFRAKSTRREISYIESACVQQDVTANRESALPIEDLHFIDLSPPFFCAVQRSLN